MPKKEESPLLELKSLLAKLLPPENNYNPQVKKEQQQKQLNAMQETLSNESFYFVFNLLTCNIEHVTGVEKSLGYPEKDFTVHRYMNCVHPGQSVQFNMIAQSMYKILCSSTFKLQFSSQRYISLIGLRHYNGEYIVFKKTTSIFQYDDRNRLLAQLNEFTRIDNYDGDALRPRITETKGFQKDDFERLVFQMVLKEFMKKRYFSEKEFEVLKYYAMDTSMTRKKLAALLQVTLTTIDTYSKRILTKSRNTFTHPFEDVREVAAYLKKEKIL